MSRHARIVLDTQENLTAEQLTELFALHEKVGWFMFLPSEQKATDKIELPEIHLDEDAGEKSPSQRLRNVLFIYWKQKGSKDDFELFYRRWMERAIDKVKQTLL